MEAHRIIFFLTWVVVCAVWVQGAAVEAPTTTTTTTPKVVEKAPEAEEHTRAKKGITYSLGNYAYRYGYEPYAYAAPYAAYASAYPYGQPIYRSYSYYHHAPYFYL